VLAENDLSRSKNLLRRHSCQGTRFYFRRSAHKPLTMQVPYAGSGRRLRQAIIDIGKARNFFTFLELSLLLRLPCDKIFETLVIRAEKASNLCILADHTVKMAAASLGRRFRIS